MFQAMEVDEYASCKIQSVYRGHKSRLFVRAARLQREYDRVFNAAAKLQSTWRGHCDRCFARDLRYMLAQHLQEHSALHVQRIYRGHIGRQHKRARFLTVSATALQAAWRDPLFQKIAGELDEVQVRALIGTADEDEDGEDAGAAA